MAAFGKIHDAQSVTGSSTADGMATPSTETFADDPSIVEWLHGAQPNHDTFGPLRVTRDADPVAGDTFLIIDANRNLVLTCYRGQLRFQVERNVTEHSQWLCTTRDGFFGFRNVAEGSFLGHDIWWNFYAKVHHHRGWESFKTEKRPGGRYWIQALHWWKFWQVSSLNYGLRAEKDRGTLWEFVRVHT